jgi:hypothetical protein
VVLAAATADLIQVMESCGVTLAGVPWRTLASGAALAGQGPLWLVQGAVVGDVTTPTVLPADIEVQEYGSGEELSITMPGRHSMAKYCTAISRLLAHPFDAAFPDIARLRQVVHQDGVEFSAPIRRADR